MVRKVIADLNIAVQKTHENLEIPVELTGSPLKSSSMSLLRSALPAGFSPKAGETPSSPPVKMLK